ncbi:MAG TPA: hypothetical protein VGQ17_01475 [Gemmatimonadales bacterium]|jgi:hypothetical protein|nr:hypothetical protein [Gemmatimonadales bacterium]
MPHERTNPARPFAEDLVSNGLEEMIVAIESGRLPGQLVQRVGLLASGLYASTDPLAPPSLVAETPLSEGVAGGWPRVRLGDGLARRVADPATAAPAPSPIDFALMREELRLDVDGAFPLMVASGTLYRHLTTRVHWIANLRAVGPVTWAGTIWYKDGNAAALPQTNVSITAHLNAFPTQRSATVTFSGGGAPNRVVVLKYVSTTSRSCEFEYDTVQGTNAVTSFNTATHPNRPAALPIENLTIERIYRRAGIQATVSPGSGTIPIAGAGVDLKWSDAEMHDAMQTAWSHFANKPQWAAWALFAAEHETGPSLGGIMFDSSGTTQRQGCAIFENSFINTPPPGDPNAAAAVERIKFWTAVHEIGHTFNLAHSWQKSLGVPWIPLLNDPEARSFMNYPYRVAGGATAFFANFEYRFTDQELLFLRHAPARLVEQGNATWFDHHGFEQAHVAAEPSLTITARVNRARPEFEFLEPVVIELKLKNISTEPQIVDRNLLRGLENLTVITKKQGSPAQQFAPFAHYCYLNGRQVLTPGESVCQSLFLSVGNSGWHLAEPGRYLVQVALHRDSGDLISEPLMLRIAPPTGYSEEYLAQDFFTDEVGRVLSFDGSRTLGEANDTLRDVVGQLPSRRVATHAKIALACPESYRFKSLSIDSSGKKSIADTAVQPRALEELAVVLRDNALEAAETLGHVDTKYYSDLLAQRLADAGQHAEAAKVESAVLGAFEKRKVRAAIVSDVRGRRDAYQKGKSVRANAGELESEVG